MWTSIEKKRSYDHQRQELAKLKGICIRCSTALENLSFKACQACRDVTNARVKATYKKLREAVLDKFDRKCECCGETEPLFLTLDHINGKGWENGDNHKQPKLFRQILSGERHDIRLLCFNCNSGRHINKGVCPHLV